MRPRIKPISAEAVKAGQAALDSFNGVVFVPEGAASFTTKNGTGRRWSARIEIVKATLDVGGKKDEPNEDEAVYYILAKALPFTKVDKELQVPAGTIYHLKIRVNYAKLGEGDEMAVRNEASLMTLFSALGADVAGGITEDMIHSAFPSKDNAASGTLRGQRAFVTLSLNPSNREGGSGFLNVDRFLPDTE